MTEGDHGEETGFGIATSPPDNEHSFLVVDCLAGTVSVTLGDPATDSEPVQVIPFDAYVASPVKWNYDYDGKTVVRVDGTPFPVA